MVSIGILAKELDVDRDKIKEWTIKFSDFLSDFANPPKGETRQYNQADQYALALIAYLYDTDDRPNVDESIRAALEQNEHLQMIPIHEQTLFPDALDYPEILGDLDSTYIGGMASGAYDRLAIADAYKRAGDILVESGESAWDIVYPTIFVYRHSIELYIKIFIRRKKKKRDTHDLKKLFPKLEAYIQQHYNALLPAWFKDRILEFQRIDTQAATAFRYDDEDVKDEVLVILPLLQQVMDKLQNAFHLLVKDYEENTTIHALGRTRDNL